MTPTQAPTDNPLISLKVLCDPARQRALVYYKSVTGLLSFKFQIIDSNGDIPLAKASTPQKLFQVTRTSDDSVYGFSQDGETALPPRQNYHPLTHLAFANKTADACPTFCIQSVVCMTVVGTTVPGSRVHITCHNGEPHDKR
jgi:hypothetical protein